MKHFLLTTIATGLLVGSVLGNERHKLRVGASSVNLTADGQMVLAGYIQSRYADNQEGELRVTAVICEKSGVNKIAIISCDVLWIPRHIVDDAAIKIEKKPEFLSRIY